MFIFLQRGPFQINFCFWIDHFDTQGKSVDIGCHAEDRIICNITDFVRVCHHTGQNADEKFCLIHSSIISTDIFVGGIQGTVQDLDFRMVNCYPQAGT